MMLIGDSAPLRFCRGCGCDDNNACVGTLPGGRSIACSWVLLDIEAPSGICSACAIKMRWNGRVMAAIGTEDEHLLVDDEAPAPQLVLP